VATYEEYMSAARNADAAGDQAAARQLVQAAIKARGEQAPQDQIDTFGEKAEDVGRAAAAGAGRGVIGTLELPEMAARGLLRLGQEGLQAMGYDVGEDIPVLDTATGRALRSGVEAIGLEDELAYRGQTRGARILGTAAEFAGGGGGLGIGGKGLKTAGQVASKLAPKAGGVVESVGQKLISAGVSAPAIATAGVAGVGSELAGEATEGTIFEPYARIAGALATPAAAAKAFNIAAKPYDKLIKPSMMAKQVNTGNRSVDEALGKAIVQPKYENQVIAKNAAYKAADELGDVFTPTDISGLAEGARSRLFAGERGTTRFNPDHDEHIVKALARIDDAASSSTGFIGMDALKRQLYSLYRKGLGQGEQAYDPRLKSVIDDLDDLMASKSQGSRLMNAARLANKRLKKSELLRDRLEIAELETAAAGTGSNILNKYKQAINKIINSKRDSAYFDEGELNAMKAIVSGGISDDILRKIGGLSPTGDRMRSAIFGVAAIMEPMTLTLSAAGLGGKFFSDSAIKSQLADLDRLLSTGATPTRITPPMAPRALGLAAEDEEQ